MQLSNETASSPVFLRLNDYMSRQKELSLSSGASLCLIHRDAIVHEWYEGQHDRAPGSRRIDADSQFHLASVRKTYLGFAVSLAIEEGRIASVDDLAADYLADADRSLLAGTTIRHLLTHTHGLQARGIQARVFPPGTDWSYNNTGLHLLFRIVGNVFGKPLADVLRERVFEPLGFSQTGWRKERTERLVWMNDDRYDDDHGADNNMFASTRELAYWGYLHAAKGVVGGKQIVPSGVFERAAAVTSPEELPADRPRNGFIWRVQERPSDISELGPSLPAGSYQSLGAYGCAVLVLPSHDAVAVRMLNQCEKDPPGYDYLADIRGFGDVVKAALEYASIIK
ncbi:serine hydrolase domain-containing protein [Paenibacillus sacheonensis]|uniref:Serine hydrolase n=1 Tax=Paenibacillus sacheonensis TaxID=742054 RepID=A0A7X4YUD0_9BACL|nr:serine hydrolase domain-containing protein [Paenibacillus sacheonensis]MBM7569269.1 CubicO group peptidase (beta-lactamase class C family) [Paenibacillus sacheonensis]NBC71721.1 serine hydrolase [Paenibacillus sacheonensis]